MQLSLVKSGAMQFLSFRLICQCTSEDICPLFKSLIMSSIDNSESKDNLVLSAQLQDWHNFEPFLQSFNCKISPTHAGRRPGSFYNCLMSKEHWAKFKDLDRSGHVLSFRKFLNKQLSKIFGYGSRWSR